MLFWYIDGFGVGKKLGDAMRWKCKGAAELAALNAAVVLAAVVMAVAGIAQAEETVNVPVSLGGLLQILAIGLIAVVWWLVRGAYSAMQKNIALLQKQCSALAERLSYVEGTCNACALNAKGSGSQRIQRAIEARKVEPDGSDAA